jgi:hypothetical protein
MSWKVIDMTNTIETFTKHLEPMGFTPDEYFYGEDNMWELEHPERGMFAVELLPPGHSFRITATAWVMSITRMNWRSLFSSCLVTV